MIQKWTTTFAHIIMSFLFIFYLETHRL